MDYAVRHSHHSASFQRFSTAVPNMAHQAPGVKEESRDIVVGPCLVRYGSLDGEVADARYEPNVSENHLRSE